MPKKVAKHLLFYDGECALCDRFVNFVLKIDSANTFNFAPQQGKMAQLWLLLPPEEDTVVLIENYTTHPRVHTLSPAVFRTLYLIGGLWKLPGLLYYLPASWFNWAYRALAKRRKTLSAKLKCTPIAPRDKERFLP